MFIYLPCEERSEFSSHEVIYVHGSPFSPIPTTRSTLTQANQKDWPHREKSSWNTHTTRILAFNVGLKPTLKAFNVT